MVSGARLLMERDEYEARKRWAAWGYKVGDLDRWNEQTWWTDTVPPVERFGLGVLFRPREKDIGVQEMRDVPDTDELIRRVRKAAQAWLTAHELADLEELIRRYRVARGAAPPWQSTPKS